MEHAEDIDDGHEVVVNAGNIAETVAVVLSPPIDCCLRTETLFDMSLCTRVGVQTCDLVQLYVVDTARRLHSSSDSKGDRSTLKQAGAR